MDLKNKYMEQDSIRRIQKIINYEKSNNVFVVTGRDLYKKSGADIIIEEGLKNINFNIFSDFNENPCIEDVVKGIKRFHQINPDFIIAIGGGSSIDMAKLIKHFVHYPGNIKNAVIDNKPVDLENTKILAIPTTAGTGSEETSFAVVYVDKRKYSIVHKFIKPDYVILDAGLIRSLPKYITAVTGFDALAQSIESYWAVGSNIESKKYASTAIELILNNLIPAVNHPNEKNRESMLISANLSGKAINISKTTGPHALSYRLTKDYNIPHGHAVALTLWKFIKYNFIFDKDKINDPRGLDYYKNTLYELLKIMKCKDEMEFSNRITDIMDAVGLKKDFKDFNIKKEAFETIINSVNVERLSNNPVKLNKNDIIKLLEIEAY